MADSNTFDCTVTARGLQSLDRCFQKCECNWGTGAALVLVVECYMNIFKSHCIQFINRQRSLCNSNHRERSRLSILDRFGSVDKNSWWPQWSHWRTKIITFNHLLWTMDWRIPFSKATLILCRTELNTRIPPLSTMKIWMLIWKQKTILKMERTLTT